nr:NS7b protein [Deltacoronavirus sp.]
MEIQLHRHQSMLQFNFLLTDSFSQFLQNLSRHLDCVILDEVTGAIFMSGSFWEWDSLEDLSETSYDSS